MDINSPWSLLHLICIHFVSLLAKFQQNLSSDYRDIEQRSSKKCMKIGRFLDKITPWRRQVGKNLMRRTGKRIYRRFRISNQIFGSISGSGDIARSLDTTFCRFWPKSQLCGWISREPDFCWTCGFRRLFIDTLYYRFQSKKDGSSWLDFQKMSKNHSKMYIFVLYGWTKFFFENRASSLF